MGYPNPMDHIEVLREKIGRLRGEISHLMELHAEYRRAGSQGRHEIQAQIAHGKRQERLQAIQQELAQLADLGRRVISAEDRKEKHRSKMHVVTKAS